MDPLALLAPSRCAACRARAAPPWCDRCEAAAARLEVAAPCERCGAAARSPGHAGCFATDAPIRGTLVLYRYRGVVAATVVASKLGGAWRTWGALGERLGSTLGGLAGPDVLADLDAVVPVPTDDRRRRERGFDHTRLLAAGLADSLGLPLAPVLAVRTGAPDRGAGRHGRGTALAVPEFAATRPLHGLRPVLVDDVLTSGATALAAAGALARDGATDSLLAIVARAGEQPLDGSPRPVVGPSGRPTRRDLDC